MIPETDVIPQPPDVPVPFIGQTVHYVEPSTGLHRAAITIGTFQNSDLWVFGAKEVYKVEGVQMDTEFALGTWHFIQDGGV